MQKSSTNLHNISREASDKHRPRSAYPWRMGLFKEDACIIDKNDPIVDPNSPIPFYGVGYENLSRKKNLHELITYRKEGDRYSGIEWNMPSNLLKLEGVPHDHLVYEAPDLRMQIGIHQRNGWTGWFH